MSTYSVTDVHAMIDQLAPSFGVDPIAAKSLLAAENSGSGRLGSTVRADRVSPAGAEGLFQVLPSTAAALTKQGRLATPLNDPTSLENQVTRGLSAIQEMQQRQRRPGDINELAVMFNAGTGPWKSYLSGGKIPAETEQYLTKVGTAMADQGVQMTPQQIERAAASGGNSSSTRAAGTRTTSNVYDSQAMADYNAAFGVANNAWLNAAGAVSAAGDLKGDLGMDYVGAILQAGDAAGTAAKAKTEVDLAAAQRRQEILQRANLDPRAAENRSDIALRQLDETSARLDAMRPAIDEKLAINPMEDILGWIGAQITLPGEVATYNNLARLQGDQLARYSAASQIADGQLNRTQATEADQIAAAGAADAQAIAAKTAAAAKQAQLQIVSQGAANALQLSHLAQAQLGASAQRLALTRERVTEGLNLSAAEKKSQMEQQEIEAINTILKAAGAPAQLDVLRYKSMQPAERQQLVNASVARAFGRSPSEADDFLRQYAGGLNGMANGGEAYAASTFAKVISAAEPVSEKMTTDWQAMNPGKTPNREAARKNALDTLGQNYKVAAETNMYRPEAANPYAIDYKRIFNNPKAVEQLANNSYVQTMLKLGPGGKESVGDTFDEQRAMTRLLADISLSKDPTAAIKKAAADISSFYTFASKDQQMASKYNLFGFQTPLKGYPVMMAQVNNGAKVDLADRTMVENALTKQAATDFRIKSNFVTPQQVFPWAFPASNQTPNSLLP